MNTNLALKATVISSFTYHSLRTVESRSHTKPKKMGKMFFKMTSNVILKIGVMGDVYLRLETH